MGQDVAELPLTELDLRKPWKRELMHPEMTLQLGCEPSCIYISSGRRMMVVVAAVAVVVMIPVCMLPVSICV